MPGVRERSGVRVHDAKSKTESIKEKKGKKKAEGRIPINKSFLLVHINDER